MISRLFNRWFVKAAPARLVTTGFISVILAGAFLLWLPISQLPGVRISFLDALFESTSAVCVTGLTVVPPGDTFNLFGKIVLAILIQIGGMGVILMGMFLIMITGRKVGFKTRSLFIAAQNLSAGYTHLIDIAKTIVIITFSIEAVGAIILSLCLLKYFDPLQAFGHAVFLAVSAFNNAGFDVFHGSASLIPYSDNVVFCLTITFLVIIGGFGFLALCDICRNRFKWKKFSLSTKVVVFMTSLLLISGTVLFKLMTNQTWLESWFQSTIARTAGFASYPLSLFSPGALLIFIVLMFIGASPNSTGGGIKTTTIFALTLKAFSSSAGHDQNSFFHRRIPEIIFTKASTVFFFGLGVVVIGTILISASQPGLTLDAILTEVVSAFATVGSSVGITSTLNTFSRWVIIFCMLIGRVGTVTIANALVVGDSKRSEYTEETILIG